MRDDGMRLVTRNYYLFSFRYVHKSTYSLRFTACTVGTAPEERVWEWIDARKAKHREVLDSRVETKAARRFNYRLR